MGAPSLALGRTLGMAARQMLSSKVQSPGSSLFALWGSRGRRRLGDLGHRWSHKFYREKRDADAASCSAELSLQP